MFNVMRAYFPRTGRGYAFIHEGHDSNALLKLRARLANSREPNTELQAHWRQSGGRLPIKLYRVATVEGRDEAEVALSDVIKVCCLDQGENYNRPECFEPAVRAGPALAKKLAELEAQVEALKKTPSLPVLMVDPETGAVLAAFSGPEVAAEALGRSENKLKAALESGEPYADYAWKLTDG